MPVNFACDLTGTATPLTHFWEYTVGSGHATLALRADWQAQLLRTHDELGFRHMRSHGLLCDDVGVEALNSASICQSQLQPFEIQGNIITLELTLPPQAVASVNIEYASLLS